MPLKPGRRNIGYNIRELMSTGISQKQSTAIALKKAGVVQKRK